MNQARLTTATATVAGAAPRPALPPTAHSLLLRDVEDFPAMTVLRQASPAKYRQCREIQQRTRDYARHHVLPHVLQWDQVSADDHGFVPWPAIDAALDYGFLSATVPGLFGGGNYGPVPVAVWAEELAAADAGLFVVFGAHGLAWALIATSLDLRMMRRIGTEIADGERNGKPVLLALAHTEAGGGSDVEDVDDINLATIGSRWTKVPGGYRVRARKMFCSNGAIARYIVLTAYGDPARPLETMCSFVIPSGTAGLSIGRAEHKLGQRLCLANEMACDDVFVPDADAIVPGDANFAGRVLDSTLTLTRGPVGAMSAGILRNATERVLDYLAVRPDLAAEQWVRLALADMAASLQAARGLYLDAAFASDAWGFSRLIDAMPRHVPSQLTHSRLLRGVTDLAWLGNRLRADYLHRSPTPRLQRCVAHSSIAKFMASDLAVAGCMKAIEILGTDANDPRWGVEKCLRDAKLAQIFEGTNQINRLHVARGVLG